MTLKNRLRDASREIIKCEQKLSSNICFEEDMTICNYYDSYHLVFGKVTTSRSQYAIF
jgi:hypothetical protein